jgi:hypothetical protein
MAKQATKKIDPQREWFWRTLIAALFAIGGFVTKDLYTGWRQSDANKRAVATASLESLKELATRLDESYRIYVVQNGQAERLLRSLQQRHGSRLPEGLGYDETFFVLGARLTRPEAELQRLIRSTTMNSQRRANLALSAWLERNAAFLHDDQPTPARLALAAELRMLKLHLNQWHDKYDAWIPGDARRSLVYLADEAAHGVGFPPGLEDAVKNAIANWG